MQKKKVGILHSIKTRLNLLIAVSIIATGFLMMLTYSPNVKEELTEMSQNYMNDLALAYGIILNDEIETKGSTNAAFTTEFLSTHLADAGMKGVSSSYIYLVAPDGTMLFHPQANKIGQPVENEVVKGITADLQANRKVENKVVTYLYKGAMKYAAYYVNDNSDFILVVTADEKEIFSPVDTINSHGMIGLAAAFVICATLATIYVSITLVNPIHKIQKITEKVANMDFTEDEIHQKLNRRKDEIGQMAHAFHTLREKLIEVITLIRTECDTLVSAADLLADGAGRTSRTMTQVENTVIELAKGSTEQSEETLSTSENVIYIGDMVKDTSTEVNSLTVSARKVEEANENAKKILAELREISRKSDEYIDIIAKQTETTNESALKIVEATKLIADIASETNLLSLNASIEAARAGEQGRGFAVVASEIQKLAEQSTHSAQRIDEIIGVLLKDSEKAVTTMNQVKTILGKQTECIQTTDKAFLEIESGIEDALKGMKVIAGKTQEMDKARVNVIDGVNNLTAISQENAASTQETSASVAEISSIINDIAEETKILNTIAEELEAKIAIFKL